ncbi:MAG: CFI-box-CTERM domain-containing protein [Burkholderiales bacterium]
MSLTLGRLVMAAAFGIGALAPLQVRAQSAAPAAVPAPPVYVPTAEAVAKISEETAKQTITELSQRRGMTGMVVFGRELHLMERPSQVESVSFADDRMVIKHENGEIVVPYASMPKAQVVEDSVLGLPQYGVPVNATDVLWTVNGGFDADERKNNAIRLADALEVLRTARIGAIQTAAQFEQDAARYRALAQKPALPEEARRFKVQAEFALGQKRYGDAIRFYGEGLKIAPWWPEGHFNRALLLAQTQRYGQATIEMRRYLELEPNAPDARAAQDRIYQWEAARQMAAENSGSTFGGPSATLAGSDNCFIATAAYGSRMHPYVRLLRAFRDRDLLTNAPGRWFVATYYRLSPPVAQIIARHETLRAATRWMLWPLVFAVADPRAAAILLWAALACAITVFAGWRLQRRKTS